MRIAYIGCIGNTAKVWGDVLVKQGCRSELKGIIYSIIWQLIRTMLLAWIAIETGSLDRRAIFSQNLLTVAYKDGNAH
jgi:hypothetical protein